MLSPPPCDALGSQCRELRLTLRVADLPEDGPEFQDAIATWLLGHRERMAFGQPYVRGTRLLVDATMRVDCKFLRTEGRQRTAGNEAKASCAAHGFRGRVPAATQVPEPPLRHDSGTFSIVQDQRMQTVALQPAVPKARTLPTLELKNPCAGAPCRTNDNQRGAACCRDLTIEIVLSATQIEKEALIRSRRAPYLCKVSRTDHDILECEVISACGYLDQDLQCSLHSLVRASGAPAKPSICSDWPDIDPDTTYHPGCRLIPESRRPVPAG